jgi:hypothetical protein
VHHYAGLSAASREHVPVAGVDALAQRLGYQGGSLGIRCSPVSDGRGAVVPDVNHWEFFRTSHSGYRHPRQKRLTLRTPIWRFALSSQNTGGR